MATMDKAKCGRCGGIRALRTNGIFRRHNDGDRPCPGSRRTPEASRTDALVTDPDGNVIDIGVRVNVDAPGHGRPSRFGIVSDIVFPYPEDVNPGPARIAINLVAVDRDGTCVDTGTVVYAYAYQLSVADLNPPADAPADAPAERTYQVGDLVTVNDRDMDGNLDPDGLSDFAAVVVAVRTDDRGTLYSVRNAYHVADDINADARFTREASDLSPMATDRVSSLMFDLVMLGVDLFASTDCDVVIDRGGVAYLGEITFTCPNYLVMTGSRFVEGARPVEHVIGARNVMFRVEAHQASGIKRLRCNGCGSDRVMSAVRVGGTVRVTVLVCAGCLVATAAHGQRLRPRILATFLPPVDSREHVKACRTHRCPTCRPEYRRDVITVPAA